MIERPSGDFLANYDCCVMEQTYLVSDHNEASRVRKCTKQGATTYVHTRKVHITAVTRIEEEHEISNTEYLDFMKQADPTRKTISKVRYYIPNKGLIYELDCFCGIKSVAYLEVELQSESQVIAIPNGINVMREVTHEKAYTNKSLAKAFPKEFK